MYLYLYQWLLCSSSMVRCSSLTLLTSPWWCLCSGSPDCFQWSPVDQRRKTEQIRDQRASTQYLPPQGERSVRQSNQVKRETPPSSLSLSHSCPLLVLSMLALPAEAVCNELTHSSCLSGSPRRISALRSHSIHTPLRSSAPPSLRGSWILRLAIVAERHWISLRDSKQIFPALSLHSLLFLWPSLIVQSLLFMGSDNLLTLCSLLSTALPQRTVWQTIWYFLSSSHNRETWTLFWHFDL